MANQKNEVYTAIGEMVVEYSFLDFLLRAFIGDLTSHEERTGFMLASELNNFQIHSILSSLGHEKFRLEESATALDALLNEIKKIQARRNDIIHSLWIVTDSEASRSKMGAKFKAGFTSEEENLQIPSLNKFSQQISQMSAHLMDFWRQVELKESKTRPPQ